MLFIILALLSYMLIFPTNCNFLVGEIRHPKVRQEILNKDPTPLQSHYFPRQLALVHLASVFDPAVVVIRLASLQSRLAESHISLSSKH